MSASSNAPTVPTASALVSAHGDHDERYALALESTSFGAYDWDILRNTIYYSPVLRVMLGLSAAELATPQDWMNCLHPDDLPFYRHALIQHLKGATPRFECDVRYKTESGTWHWARQYGIAQRDGDGRAIRLVGATGNITELKQRERAVQSARTAVMPTVQAAAEPANHIEQRYALALDALSENLYDWNIDSGEVYYSPSLRAMLGLGLGPELAPDERLALADWAGRIHPDDRAIHDRALVAHFRQETPRFECDFRYRAPDGTWRWARQHGIALRDATGRARRMVGTASDVTAAKEREGELLSARAELALAYRDVEHARAVMQTVLENMNDGVMLFDKNLRLQFINQQLIDMQGYPPDLVRPGAYGRELVRFQAERGDFGPTDDIERTIDERAAMVLQEGGTRYKRRTANGRDIEFSFKRSSEGGLLAICRDITELKERETALAAAKEAAEAARDRAERERAEAEAANQSKSTFLATMSHEIRTPMNGVLGMIEVLERQGLDAGQRRTVATMRESAAALLHIIDDVLDFSKIEAGRLDLEETAFSLSGLIEGVASSFRQPASVKGLELEVETIAGSNDALVGDPGRTRQILFNLLGNAVKFTERGRIRLQASAAPLGAGMVRVSLRVTDTGIGLSEAERRRLFQPFAQADSSTTRRFGGTGLGLSIVRRLAQLMNGDVGVESRPGIGSTFTVMLTMRAAPADSPLNTMLRASPRPAGTAATDGAKPRPRVLVADDHPVNREVLLRQLEVLGIAADTVNDGQSALAAWIEGGHAAVLADIHMPRMDGHEFTRKLRKLEAEQGGRRPRTPVIAVTANAMKGAEERCLAVGMDAYLAKPVGLGQLRTTLERWLPLADDPNSAGEARRKDAGSAIDLGVLAAWLGDDRTALNALMAKFRDTALETEREISAASRVGNLAALAAAAHKLKGAAQMIGASGISEAAAQLERSGKAGDRARCREGLGPLAAELRHALAEIDSMAEGVR